MPFTTRAVIVSFTLALLAPLAGCKEEAPCDACGVVESIATREVTGDASGAGAVAGAVIGGVIGHQIGSGSGNKVATVGGVAGGAVAGNAIEKEMKKQVVYDVTIRMEKDGTTRVITLAQPPQVLEGDEVRVVGKDIERV